jgi:hypothetical protein
MSSTPHTTQDEIYNTKSVRHSAEPIRGLPVIRIHVAFFMLTVENTQTAMNAARQGVCHAAPSDGREWLGI